MSNWIEDIKLAMADADRELDRQWLEQAQRQATYSVLPALLFLKHNGIEGNEDILARLSISFPDRLALALSLGEDASRIAHFYPCEAVPQTPDTNTTIDRFLDKYGKTSTAEVEAITQAIFNPTPDYADVLAAQEKEEGGLKPQQGDSQDELINQFIAEQIQLSDKAAKKQVSFSIDEQEKAEIADEVINNPTENDDSMLSESLAKMYIARHKYSQALEIIKRLSLKYPEKSIYFADQIRFLAKLVLNETLNNKK